MRRWLSAPTADNGAQRDAIRSLMRPAAPRCRLPAVSVSAAKPWRCCCRVLLACPGSLSGNNPPFRLVVFVVGCCCCCWLPVPLLLLLLFLSAGACCSCRTGSDDIVCPAPNIQIVSCTPPFLARQRDWTKDKEKKGGRASIASWREVGCESHRLRALLLLSQCHADS